MDNDTQGERLKTQPLSGRAGSAARDDLPKFYYVNVVWGADYVHLFTRYSLPTLLSPGNLPCLPNRHVSEFLIVTPEEDAERIRASAIFDRLSERIKVVFIPIAITTEHKYDLMTHGHRLAVDYVARKGYCIFLSPDALLSDGGLKRLFELATAGRRVVGVFGARVNEEAVGEELCSSCHYRQGEPLCLEPRQLVELMTRHLHSDLRHHYVDSAYFPEKPYACIWPAPSGKGMLVRSLNLHPLLFDCQLVPEGENIAHLTIDWYLIPRFVTDWNDFYVEKDSDKLCIIELSPSTLRAKPAKLGSPDAGALSLWLLRGRHALMNRASFLFPIMFHTGSLDKAWDELVRRTGEFALEVADPNGAARESTLLGHALQIVNDIFQTAKGVERPTSGFNDVIDCVNDVIDRRVGERVRDATAVFAAEREAFIARIRELEAELQAKQSAYAGLIADMQATSEAERQAAVARIRELEGEVGRLAESGRLAARVVLRSLRRRIASLVTAFQGRAH